MAVTDQQFLDTKHKHHITPRYFLKHKSINFIDDKENLVELTYEEHCKAHKWIAMLTQDEIMWWSWQMMQFQGKASRYLGMTPYNYGIPNPILSKLRKGDGNPMYGKTHSPEARKKISAALSKRIITKEQLDKQSKSKKKDWDNNPERKSQFSKRMKSNNPMKNKETRKKLSESLKHRPVSDHHKNVARTLMIERMKTQPLVICPYCNKKGKEHAMKRWHFKNCKFNLNVA